MKAVARKLDWASVPSEVGPFVSKNQTFVTTGRQYVVHGISVYKMVTFFLVVDDQGVPVFIPAWAFSLSSKALPSDWVCSAGLGGEVELVIGPEFVARDLEAYMSIVDQESGALELFWQHHSEGEDLEVPSGAGEVQGES